MRQRYCTGAVVPSLIWTLACLTGCVHAPPPAPVAAVTVPAPVRGTVISRRPIPQSPTTGLVLLTAMGRAVPAAQIHAAEFIVRRDEGRTVSIVQPDDAGLQPGDRVALIDGPRLQIVRAQ